METSNAVDRERNLGVADLPGEHWAHLSHVEGDIAAFREVLARADTVESFDLTSVMEGSFFAYVVYRMRPIDEAFLEAFDDHGVVVVMPVEVGRGGSTFTLVGPDDALGSLVETFEDEMVVDVRRVGEFDHWTHRWRDGSLADSARPSRRRSRSATTQSRERRASIRSPSRSTALRGPPRRCSGARNGW